jgi:hypothetical protein
MSKLCDELADECAELSSYGYFTRAECFTEGFTAGALAQKEEMGAEYIVKLCDELKNSKNKLRKCKGIFSVMAYGRLDEETSELLAGTSFTPKEIGQKALTLFGVSDG